MNKDVFKQEIERNIVGCELLIMDNIIEIVKREDLVRDYYEFDDSIMVCIPLKKCELRLCIWNNGEFSILNAVGFVSDVKKKEEEVKKILLNDEKVRKFFNKQ